MKHVDLFKDFLKDVVNLNDTRVSELEKSTEAIKDAVRASDWKPRIKGWMAQGSWAHKTIIKPVDQGESTSQKNSVPSCGKQIFPACAQISLQR